MALDINNVAFVAMKFDTEPWNDKSYQAISLVLREAGFEPIRADEIKTSGSAVNEILEYLEKAPLVVIDTTGSSSSVSYELGYCHGVKRPPNKTILIKRIDENKIPFNYQHYRHQYYKDIRHLKRLLRNWLNLSIPIGLDQLGFSYNFAISPDVRIYGNCAAIIVLEALRKMKFSGRCEYYDADGFALGLGDSYIVGLGLKSKDNKMPETDWWDELNKYIEEIVPKKSCGLSLNLCEWARLRAMRQDLLAGGVVNFDKGKPSLVIEPGNSNNDSWFIGTIMRENPDIISM